MVCLSTSDEWQRQSSLLLQARPSTTRITSKYKIPNLDEPRFSRPQKRRRSGEAPAPDTAATPNEPKIPRATLVLKTYDPESGVTLKFKTDRAAEVGRLVTGLGKLGRHMAALPAEKEDTRMEDATTTFLSGSNDDALSGRTPAPGLSGADVKTVQAPGVGGGGAGGGKKKKKNKK